MNGIRGQLGRPPLMACAVGLVVGVLSLGVGLVCGQDGPVLAAMGASFLLTAGIAAGCLALSAAVHLAEGEWASGLLTVAHATSTYLFAAVVVLGVLVLTGHRWMPDSEGLGVFFISRECVVTVLLLLAARLYVRRLARGQKIGPAAVGYLFAYVTALSSWGVDFTSGTRHWAPSTVLPPFFFMSALLGALAWSTLVALLRREQPLDESSRHDAGKLLFGLACFWLYLIFASYLPLWYANIPEETGFLFDRLKGTFRWPTLLMLLATGAFPVALLLTEWAKLKRVLLGAACVSILVGLTLECALLVFPSLPYPISRLGALLGTGVAVGMFGLFGLSSGLIPSGATAGKWPGRRAAPSETT